MRAGSFPLALAAAACLAAGPAFLAEPVDLHYVLENPSVRDAPVLARRFVSVKPPPPRGSPEPVYAWRPLTEAGFSLNRVLCGEAGAGFLAGSVLLHATAALAAYFAALALGAPVAQARFAAAFLAVHPLGSQAILYVFERGVILAAGLGFLALGLLFRGRRGWALACALLAAMSKETAATVPLSILAAAWVLRRPGGIRWTAPFLAIPALLAFLLIRAEAEQRAAGASNMLAGPSPLQYLSGELPILVRYMVLHALPFPMAFHWGSAEASDLWTALSGLLLAGLLAFALFGPARLAPWRLGVALLLAPQAMESTVFPLLHPAWNYRCYPGLLGGGLLFAGMAARRPLLGAAALILLAGSAFHECARWGDRAGLAGRDVRHAFREPAPRSALGWAYLRRCAPAAAEAAFRQGGRLPWHPDSGHAQALAALPRGAAEALLARPYVPATPEYALWRARALMARGGNDEAEAMLVREEARLGGMAAFWDHLGFARLAQGKDAGAEAAYRQGLSLDPGMPTSLYHLGLILLKRGDREEARLVLEECLRLTPVDARVIAALRQAGGME